MTQWRTQGFWSKAGTYTLVALLMMFPGYSGDSLLSSGASNRKRVFSPRFVVLCVFVTVLELAALSHFYGVRR
jgi:hypothetical protein